MQFSMIFSSLCVSISSIVAFQLTNKIGHVTDDKGMTYQLEETGHDNVRVITQEREDGYYIHPVSYHIEPGRACGFYSESTRGIGYLIGEFEGPIDADFGSHWAAFYECWDVILEPTYSARRRRRFLQPTKF